MLHGFMYLTDNNQLPTIFQIPINITQPLGNQKM